MVKRICVLGSTGSIGRNALDVASRFPGRFRITGLAAGSNADALVEQANRFRPAALALSDEASAKKLERGLAYKARCFFGRDAFYDVLRASTPDTVLLAISGSASIVPAFHAVSMGKRVALASKEALVSAGHIITAAAKKSGAALIPVDSEHSAVFQCLKNEDISCVKRIYLTSSGGPFLDTPMRRFSKITPREALRHPRWKMGRKISTDSATMMNKGLEVIEAKWLFGVDVSKIEILIHPEAVVHSMVEFTDGSVIAQLGITDMRLPIQYALSYPERLDGGLGRLDFGGCKGLTFRRPDRKKFPCIDLAYAAAAKGGSMPAVLSAANETAVARYLLGDIAFDKIPAVIEKVMGRHRWERFPSIERVMEIDRRAKEEAERIING